MKQIEGIDIKDISKHVAYNMWQSAPEDLRFVQSPVKRAFDDWYATCAGSEEQIFRELSRRFGASTYDYIIPLRVEGSPPFFVLKHNEKGLQILFAANGYSSDERSAIIGQLKDIVGAKKPSFLGFVFRKKTSSANEWWQFTSTVAARTETLEVGGVSKGALS